MATIQVQLTTEIPAGVRVFDVTGYGATGDGVTDDSVAIRNAIAAASGGGVVYLPNGTYLVSRSASNEGCLNLTSNIHLMGQSRDGTVIKMAGAQDGFTRPIRLQSADNVTISNLTIDGNRANQTHEEHMAGIFAGTCKRLHIHHVTSKNHCGDAIDIHQDCEDVLIEFCLGLDCGRSGVAINGGGQKRITIRKCQMKNNDAQQIDTELDSGFFVQDIVIQDNHLVTLTDYALTVSGTDWDSQSTGFLIEGNVIEGPVFMVWAKNVQFLNNKVFTRSGDLAVPLHLSRRCEDVCIRGNEITYNATSSAISPKAVILVEGVESVDKPTNIVVEANNVTTTQSADGIYFIRPYSASVLRNTFLCTASTAYNAIEIRATESDSSHQVKNFRVEGNRVTDFAKGVVCLGVTSQPGAIHKLLIIGNHFERSALSSMICLDLDEDNLHVVQAATVIGNTATGATMFSGTYGGWPVGIVVLIGGTEGNCGVYSGTGAPGFAENVGAMYLRRDGGTGSTLYVKESGTGTSGWVAK